MTHILIESRKNEVELRTNENNSTFICEPIIKGLTNLNIRVLSCWQTTISKMKVTKVVFFCTNLFLLNH